MKKEVSKQPDAYRQRIERDGRITSDAQNRLVAKVESEVANKFIQLYQNAKLLGLSKTDLTSVEGPTSSINFFNGTITVKAQVMANSKLKHVSVPVKIAESTFVLNMDDLKQLIEEASEIDQYQEFDVEGIEAETLEADLSQFQLKDEGEDHYKIFHPALDIGRELATVSKNEYATIKDKETLFRDALENQLVGSKFDGANILNFTGSFVEPKIEVTEKDLGTYERVSLTEEEANQPEEDRLIATIGDTYRQSIEAKEKAANDAKSKLVDRIVNAVVSQLSSLRYGNVKVSSVSDKLSYSGSNFNGSVEIKTNLFAESGPKDIVLPLEVKDNTFKLLRPETIKEIVEKGIDPRDTIADQIEQETQEKIVIVDEHSEYADNETDAALEDKKSSIKKEAADAGGIEGYGPIDVMYLPKHLLGLPEDIKIGTVIWADGCHWKLTSKSDKQLSKGEGDGSIYTFSKVPVQDKEPEYKLSR